jgi:hypothetical protein
MTDLLYRCEFHEPEQAHQVLSQRLWPWAKDQMKHGRELVLEARLLDDDITDKQRGFLHGVVLAEIAQQLRPNGQSFAMAVWKEHFRAKYLGFKVVTSINPFTGKKHRRRVRISTEDLGVRRMADYIDQIMADVAEYGITISEPLPPELRPGRRRPATREHIDEDGVITEVAA